MDNVRLIHLNSDYIVEFISHNPINWYNDHKILAKRNGLADQQGSTPTPAVREFLSLLSERENLFTQKEYGQCCFDLSTWKPWLERMTVEARFAVWVKLCRNFYAASMIDTLHVWSLLAEAGWFDVCIVDAVRDAVGKTDLTLFKDGEIVKVSLFVGTRQAIEDRVWKQNHRGGCSVKSVEVPLPLDRPMKPGNKRWYNIDDFAELREISEVLCEKKKCRSRD